MLIDKLVNKSIKISLVVQVLTTLVGLDGFNIKLDDKDKILKDILKIETFVQFIEGFFYLWIMFALKDMKKMTPRRYIDWSITTPIMLLSTIIFFKYSEYKENNQDTGFTLTDFYNNNKENIIKLIIYNAFMLLFGFLGETNMIDKRIGIPIGFFFFYKSFSLIYNEYAIHSEIGKTLFKILVFLWALYGVSAMLPIKEKNLCYNILDIFAKNFYGLYIYYLIRQVQVE
jgi:bacteriorhodopsin